MIDVKANARPTLRDEQAAITRRRILDAARRLFFRDGYAATTLKAVAVEAGVAVQTVYAVFGSKPAILEALRSLVADLPEADDAFRSAMEQRTADACLAAFAHSIRRRWELAGDIVKVDEDAARADPGVRAGVSAALEQRRLGIAALARRIAALSPGTDEGRAAAVLDALTLHALFARLVDVHGWSPEAYESWLAWQLVAGVREGAAPHGARGVPRR